MDLSFLKPLYSRPGPYVSVYADLTRTTEDAGKAAELRWRALRAELEAQDAPGTTLRAVDRAVQEELAARRSVGLVLFAADGEVTLAERLPHPPRAETARVSVLPHVMPYLSERGERFPHVVAKVDRRGGEIDCVGPDGRHRHIDVPGDEEYPIRKVKAGDWNQSRFQRSTENVWKHNAKKVAREVDKVARDVHAEAVVIAGDPRARTTVLEEVSPDVLECAVESDRGEALDIDLDRILELKSTERVFSVTERFERELAHGARAVTGLPATVEAVRKGQVETLLLDEDLDSPSRLWVGPDPVDIDTQPRDGTHEERADAALIRAVAATDGDLVIVPGNGPEVTLGVGAVLRYNDSTTVHY